LRKKDIKILISIFIINVIFTSTLFSLDVHGQYIEIDPPYGIAPEIDGFFNDTDNEWDKAFHTGLQLYKNETQTDPGLPIDLWIMQNGTELYICIRFELGQDSRKDDEFMGLLITERRIIDENVNISEDIVDAKFIQFSNKTTGEFTYKDYYINEDVYYNDPSSNGNGASILEEETIVYEFQLPVNSSDDDNDVFLDYGEDYGFVIVYGEGTNYPADFKKFNIVIVEINYPPAEPPPGLWEQVRFVLSIMIFSFLGVLLGLYTYKIILLKNKIERYRKNV